MHRAQVHPATCLLTALLLTGSPDPFSDFHARLDQYVQLHRMIEVGTPPRVITRDPAQLIAASQALADAIIAARPQAQQGDIFTPSVTRALRDRIHRAFAGEDIDRFLADIHEGQDFKQLRAVVHARDPQCRVPSGLPPHLLLVLPELPDEVDYRAVGRDLVLWDEHAMMIIDFIPNAFPEQSLTLVIPRERSPSCIF